MIKVFLDIGNNFVKWATVNDDIYQLQPAFRLEDILNEGIDVFELDDEPDEVFFSSVADASLVDRLKSLIQSEWKLLPIQLTAQQSCCGLTSGYADFHSLGDDRWFAMLGAIEQYQQPCIIIDAGTALTIDAIVDGQHQGGFIVPGLHTMRASLATSTASLENYTTDDAKDDEVTDLLLAVDTSSAILGGTLYMLASFINRVIVDLNQQLSTEFKIVLTGGDAKQVMPLIDYIAEYIPDLVLQGMVYVEETVKKQ